ncbi:MAG: aldo/keto reductase, partial [Betaproteobacteria bacterium]|nr:aldo/keto reductase [Betaproteobacteria bacterium]
WAIQNNYAVLPKSIQIDRMQENFDFEFVIAENDMKYINTLDKGDSVTWEYGDPLAVK